jgi:hypothetical protein
MWVCVALLGVGMVAVMVGATGTWVVLPLVGCMLMMGVMMWMMGGMGHGVSLPSVIPYSRRVYAASGNAPQPGVGNYLLSRPDVSAGDGRRTPPLERMSRGGAVSGEELQPTITVSRRVLSGPIVAASGMPFISDDFVSNRYVPGSVNVRDSA